MNTKRFELLSNEDAAKACGLDPDSVGSYNGMFSVVEHLPNNCCAIVGSDGGEPEDQLLCRDWSWVVDALNDAFEAGVLAAKGSAC